MELVASAQAVVVRALGVLSDALVTPLHTELVRYGSEIRRGYALCGVGAGTTHEQARASASVLVFVAHTDECGEDVLASFSRTRQVRADRWTRIRRTDGTPRSIAMRPGKRLRGDHIPFLSASGLRHVSSSIADAYLTAPCSFTTRWCNGQCDSSSSPTTSTGSSDVSLTVREPLRSFAPALTLARRSVHNSLGVQSDRFQLQRTKRRGDSLLLVRLLARDRGGIPRSGGGSSGIVKPGIVPTTAQVAERANAVRRDGIIAEPKTPLERPDSRPQFNAAIPSIGAADYLLAARYVGPQARAAPESSPKSGAASTLRVQMARKSVYAHRAQTAQIARQRSAARVQRICVSGEFPAVRHKAGASLWDELTRAGERDRCQTPEPGQERTSLDERLLDVPPGLGLEVPLFPAEEY